MADTEGEKRLAAEAAAMLVEDGMAVGLGTGTTATHCLHLLGRRVAEGLRMVGIPTSEATRRLARQVGIPLTDFAEHTRLDLALDGADEVDPALSLIKGGGGALFREKIVASAAARLVIFADSSKAVQTLGGFPLPVEVNAFGWQLVAERIAGLGAEVALRHVPGGGAEEPFVTENHGYILDCRFGTIPDPGGLEERLRAIPGVMVTGLFVGMADTVLLGEGEAVRTLRRAGP